MNFGSALGFGGIIFALLLWALPLVLLVWFILTLSRMAVALRDIADRMATLERAVRDVVANRPPQR